MLIGSVTWGFDDGQVIEGGFCARAVIDGGDSEMPKMKLYQGWAVRILEIPLIFTHDGMLISSFVGLGPLRDGDRF